MSRPLSRRTIRNVSPCHRKAWGRDGGRAMLVPKRVFPSREAAEKAAGADQHAYRCPNCGKWHLTTK